MVQMLPPESYAMRLRKFKLIYFLKFLPMIERTRMINTMQEHFGLNTWVLWERMYLLLIDWYLQIVSFLHKGLQKNIKKNQFKPAQLPRLFYISLPPPKFPTHHFSLKCLQSIIMSNSVLRYVPVSTWDVKFLL